MPPSPIALAVLGLLAGGPLHPYRMQVLLKEWGKDRVVNVAQRASVYAAIKRLQSAGAIAVLQTERDQQYPERTVYEITEEGRRLALAWLADMVSTPRNQFPEFPAALSFVMLLGPETVSVHLTRRAEYLRASLLEIDGALERYSSQLPRVTLLDTEYERAIIAAELTWVSGILDDLRSGVLGWSDSDLASAADAYREE